MIFNEVGHKNDQQFNVFVWDLVHYDGIPRIILLIVEWETGNNGNVSYLAADFKALIRRKTLFWSGLWSSFFLSILNLVLKRKCKLKRL